MTDFTDWRFHARARPEPAVRTCIDALYEAARSGTTVTVLPEEQTGEVVVRSWADVELEAHRLAQGLADAGVRRGERVLILMPTGFPFLESFFALQLLGAVPVPGYPPLMMERVELAARRLTHIAADGAIERCLTDAGLAPLLGPVGAVAGLEVLDVEALPRRSPRFVLGASEHGLAALQYTSGSTGKPKGVPLTHAQVLSNCHAMGQAVGARDGDVVVSWLPLYHDLGLFASLMASVYWRVPVVLLSPAAFLMRPYRWLQAIAEYGGSISHAPTFGFARCVKRAVGEPPVDLSSWRTALCTAEPVDPVVVRAFQDGFASWGFRHDAMRAGYGLAETTAGLTLSDDGPLRFDRVDREQLAEGTAVATLEPAGAVDLPCQGRPLPGHQLRVVDLQGQPAPDRSVGEVQVRGASLFNGYHHRPGVNAEVFRGGWFCTGDLGYLVDGELYLCGRAREVLIVRGRNYHPADFEVVAESVEGVRAGCTIVFGDYDPARSTDRVIVLVEARDPGAPGLADAISAAITEEVGLRPSEVCLLPPGTLPKTPSGKRQRALARTQWVAGTLGQGGTLRSVLDRSTVGLVASPAR